MEKNMYPSRVFAVDWSGALNFKRKIVLAEVSEIGLEELKDNWKCRDTVADYLIEKGREDKNFVVGLDFAFSFPQWYLEEKRCQTAVDFWKLVKKEGEKWISYSPFFTKGTWNSPKSQYRKTEKEINERTSMNPETVFKLIGPKQVGKSSIRGMPILGKLRQNGFNIWPFDPPKLPMVVEIYPRLFYGRDIKKSDLEQRWKYLMNYPDISEYHRMVATCSDDAFDAVVSALEMFSFRKELASCPPVDDDAAKMEGLIWYPHDNT